MAAPSWLTATPIAHRGLHDRAMGRIENTPQAMRAAMKAGYAIECDVQLSADGEAMVFHDVTLDRLTRGAGPVSTLPFAELSVIPFKEGDGHIATLPAILDIVGGWVPIVCEIKSAFDGDMRLAERCAALAQTYTGPLCFKSFDPAIIIHLRRNRESLGIGHIPLGIVSEAHFRASDWPGLDRGLARALAAFTHWPESQPDFLSWNVWDLPHGVPLLCRAALGLPVVTWTVKSPDMAAAAKVWADQIVFEGFLPDRSLSDQ